MRILLVLPLLMAVMALTAVPVYAVSLEAPVVKGVIKPSKTKPSTTTKSTAKTAEKKPTQPREGTALSAPKRQTPSRE